MHLLARGDPAGGDVRHRLQSRLAQGNQRRQRVLEVAARQMIDVDRRAGGQQLGDAARIVRRVGAHLQRAAGDQLGSRRGDALGRRRGARCGSSISQCSRRRCGHGRLHRAALARDHVGFIQEPQAAVLLQHFAGGIEIAARAQHLGQALVVDLGDVHGRVPGREQRRGADALGDLGGQRVHVVAEHGAAVGIGVEIVAPGIAAKLGTRRAQQIMPAGLERVLVLPDLADDLEARIAAARMDAEQTAARTQRTRQRRHHLGGLELGRHARPIRLRGDDEIVVGARATLVRDDIVEQEAEVVAVDHQRRRPLVDRIAGLGRMPRLPDAGEQRLERGDLLAELGGRGAAQRHLLPRQRGGGRNGLRRQPRRLRVVHVGDHQHGGRMLVEAVGHLVEREARVLQADLLADHVERQRRKAPVHLAHDAGQHRAIAHAGVEHAQGRRLGMQVGELHADAPRDHLLLAAGVDEQQVLLPVVEEAEVARAVLPGGRLGAAL